LSPSSSVLLLAKTITHPAARSLCDSWALYVSFWAAVSADLQPCRACYIWSYCILVPVFTPNKYTYITVVIIVNSKKSSYCHARNKDTEVSWQTLGLAASNPTVQYWTCIQPMASNMVWSSKWRQVKLNQFIHFPFKPTQPIFWRLIDFLKFHGILGGRIFFGGFSAVCQLNSADPDIRRWLGNSVLATVSGQTQKNCTRLGNVG